LADDVLIELGDDLAGREFLDRERHGSLYCGWFGG
jgi:hypothetical protein